jgi:hypothetical protein
MSLKKPDLLTQISAHQRTSTILSSLLICLLMVTLMVGFVQLGQRLSPTWNGSYLLVIAILFSLEAVVTLPNTRQLEGRERVIFHLSEWVAFAVLIKLLIYISTGFGNFLNDLRAWQASFMDFFTLEYLLALVLAGVVWFSSRSYRGEIDDLFERERDASWDDLGKLQNALNQIRGRMMSRVFLQGTLLVVLAVFTRLDDTALLRSAGITTPGYRAPVFNVLLYFMLALVLLSQTQFALLRTRWAWLNLPISPIISRSWIKYSLLFFAVLSLVVFFLPTEYSLGLFETLQGLTDLLVRITSFLLMLFTLPLTWCLSLFNVVSEQPINSTPVAPPDFQLPLDRPTPANPFAWLVFLRSLLFWVVFLAVIFLAVSYYLRQNAPLLNAMRAFPLVLWLSRGWKALRGWLTGVNRQVSSMVKEGVKRIRLRRPGLSAPNLRAMFDIRRLSPRDQVIHYFQNLTQLASERGIEREPHQTAHQYENQLSQAVPEVEPDLHDLTEAFYEARYSDHPLDEPQAAEAGSLWDHIKRVLRKIGS